MAPKNSGGSSKFPGGDKVIHRTAQTAFVELSPHVLKIYNEITSKDEFIFCCKRSRITSYWCILQNFWVGTCYLIARFHSSKIPILYNNRGGVFEQLARYTIRYQESNLHLGLYCSSLTSANNLNLNLLTFSSLLKLDMFGWE